jgi:hypothetical protein
LPTSSEEANEILSLIAKEPYYSVRIAPTRALEPVTLREAKRVVGDNAVRLRGWDFPHFESNDVHNGSSFAFSFVNWQRHVELWRIYQSRQFVYLGASWDTAMDFQEKLRKELDHMLLPRPAAKESVAGLLSYIGVIYSVTEFYLFASRLANELNYREYVRLEIALHNVDGWALASGDPRVLWHWLYQAHVKTIRIPAPDPSELFTEADAASAAQKGLAVLFAGFNWEDSAGAIETWQRRLIERQFSD